MSTPAIRDAVHALEHEPPPATLQEALREAVDSLHAIRVRAARAPHDFEHASVETIELGLTGPVPALAAIEGEALRVLRRVEQFNHHQEEHHHARDRGRTTA